MSCRLQDLDFSLQILNLLLQVHILLLYFLERLEFDLELEIVCDQVLAVLLLHLAAETADLGLLVKVERHRFHYLRL